MTTKERASLGGRALVAKRGNDHMRAIGRNGGIETVRKHGIEYMARIASLGGFACQDRYYYGANWDAYYYGGKPYFERVDCLTGESE